MQLYETHIPVADLERSVAFYTEVLGLNLAFTQSERNVAFLWVGNIEDGMLGLWGPGNPLEAGDESPGRRHFALAVSIDRLLGLPAELQAKGVTCRGFQEETEDLPSVIGWMPSAQIYLKDPDGHSVEFIALLKDEPDTAFFGTWSEWQNRARPE